MCGISCALESRNGGRYLQKEGLEEGKYVVVHLRGGDKPWKCEEGRMGSHGSDG